MAEEGVSKLDTGDTVLFISPVFREVFMKLSIFLEFMRKVTSHLRPFASSSS